MLWSVIVSRLFGAFGFGVFNTAYSVYSFAWSFIFGGLFQGLIKYGSEFLVTDRENLSHFFSRSLRYLTFLGIVLFLVFTISSIYVKDIYWRMIIVTIGLSFLFSGAKDALSSIMGALHQSDQLSTVTSSRSIIVLVAGVVFYLFKLPPLFLPFLLVIMTIWELIISVFFIRSRLSKILSFSLISLINSAKRGISGEIKNFFQVFLFGFYISLSITAFNIMKSLDIVVIKLFFDYVDVGIYSVADTASSILFYMTSFSLPVIASISDAFAKRDNELLGENVKIAVKYPLLIGTQLTLILVLMATPIIMGIYGSEFVRAVIPLQILSIGTFLLMFGYNLSYILVGIGRSKLAGSLMVIAAIQYILSMFVLIPLYGFIGAAVSLTMTGITSLLLIPYFIWRNLKVSILSGVHKVVFSGVISGAVLYFVPKSSFLVSMLGITVSIILFVVSNYKLGYLTRDDVQMIRNVVRRQSTSS
jgi:O-antigen/teichoic acid export membrane protein